MSPREDATGADLRGRARMLLDAGRAQEALPLLQRVLASNAGDTDALCRIALAHMKLGDRQRQLEAAELALTSDPESEWACRLQFDALHALRRRQPALAAARRAVELAPNEPLAHVCLVQALLSVQKAASIWWAWPPRERELRAQADRLVELAPSRSVAHQMSGLVALHQKRLSDAEGSFRRALALDPESAMDLNNLGVALLRQRRNREALEAFEGAARLDPSLSIARSNLALGIRSNVAAGAGIVLISLAYFSLRDLLPKAAAPLLLVPYFAALIALFAFRFRKLSPTAQRFAQAEGVLSPRGLPPLQGLLLTIALMVSLVGMIMELVWLWLTPEHAVHWLAWGALFGTTLGAFVASARVLRRASRRR